MTTSTETSARTQYRIRMERAALAADLAAAVQAAKGAAAIALAQLRAHEAAAADWRTDGALVAHERLCASLWRSWYGRAFTQVDALDQQLRAAWRAAV